MQERERPCSHVRAELASVERQASLRHDTGDVERALAAMREALTDWQGMLRRETGTISPVIAETAGLQRVWWPQGDLASRRVTAPDDLPALPASGPVGPT